jgi:hypothetical protein
LKRPGRRIVDRVLYEVTVEPDDRRAHPDVPSASETVEADGKDAALNSAEMSYRRRYPRVGKLRLSVVRRHPADRNDTRAEH